MCRFCFRKLCTLSLGSTARTNGRYNPRWSWGSGVTTARVEGQPFYGLPETVDPVYGDGFAIALPFWFYMLVFVFWAIAAAIIEACVLTIRWIMGKYVLKASWLGNDDHP
jgi:hypothetical protein